MGGALPADHAHNVTVPGAPAAWFDLQRRFGTLPRDQVVAPAAALADEGYPVAPLTAALWEGGAAPLVAAQHGAELLNEGRAPRAGEVMRIATLAASLRAWGEQGAEPFYTGAIAERVAAAVGAAGGALAMDDLAATAARGWSRWRSTTAGRGSGNAHPTGRGWRC